MMSSLGTRFTQICGKNIGLHAQHAVTPDGSGGTRHDSIASSLVKVSPLDWLFYQRFCCVLKACRLQSMRCETELSLVLLGKSGLPIISVCTLLFQQNIWFNGTKSSSILSHYSEVRLTFFYLWHCKLESQWANRLVCRNGGGARAEWEGQDTCWLNKR